MGETVENSAVISSRPREYLTEREVEKLIDTAGENRWGHRDATAILVAYRHGLRASEVVSLRWDDIDFAAGKQHWLEDPIWQGVRKSIESIMGSNDYLEQYFATNVVFEPLVGELFRSGFLMQAASAQNDFITPAVVSAAEADYERNLANTVELFHMLGTDPEHGKHNIALFNSWLAKHGDLALNASNHLQPIWSQPRVKVVTFGDALAHAKNRIKGIAAELGLTVPANLAS